MIKLFSLVLIFLLVGIGLSAHAQNVSINASGQNPDNSAMLDVQSTSHGVLVPRMTMAERNAILSPATGLLLYQTDNTPGFYYNSGTPGAPVWTKIENSSSAQNIEEVLSSGNDANNLNLFNLGRLNVGATGLSGTVGIKSNLQQTINLQSNNNTDSTGISWQNTGGAYTWSIFRNNEGAGDASLVFAGGSNAANPSSLAERMRISDNGNLGIGTTSPSAKLTLAGSGGVDLRINSFGFPNTENSSLNFSKARGSEGAETTVILDDILGQITGIGYDGAAFSNAAKIVFEVDQTPGIGDMPGRIKFLTTADGSTIPLERMRIDSDGRVGIGIINPDSLLQVFGGAQIERLNIAGQYTFPNSDGNFNEVLTTNGAGMLAWQTVSGASTPWNTSGSDLGYTAGNVGIGTNSPNAILSINGSISRKISTLDIGTTNIINNLSIPADGDIIRIVGPNSNATISGIQASFDGRFITFFNASSFSVTFSHNGGASTAINRLLMHNGVDIALPPNSSIQFAYSTADNRWIGIGYY